ncbi:ARM repeat-containing protein [Venustampulla echinocandica]|uniref:ARM repeat-containing protein n=1 Tax=Venustampulla echinocandica TaxID=2656787 RepID=A0A370U319_9HELO|nr:ARM repeat-containing protein [Venustampulla echinocandica]RDL42133.1 ARM repeat-containing protein [Venustampulla echinocandica]
MARRNSKAVKGAKVAAAVDGETLPSFDENALSALTSKIEQGFGKGKAPPKAADAPNPKQKKKEMHNASTATESKPTSKPETTRGTKRDANGNTKVNSESKAQKIQKNRKGVQVNDDKAALLQEILALGGNEEDLDLVADVASEDEDHDTGASAAPDKSLQKELAKFVAGLGIEGQLGADTVDSEEENEQGDEEGGDDWEEASDSDHDPSDSTLEAISEQKKGATVPVDVPSSNDPNRLIFEARPDWHAASLPNLPAASTSGSAKYDGAIESLKQYAVSLLEKDSNLYASKHLSSSSSHRFLSTIMSSGTLSDKVSALTLVIQESPVHTTQSFENLLVLAKKRSRAQAVNALGALKDLLGSGVVLPSDRRLRSFASQPGLLGTLQENSVASWKLGQRLPGNLTKSLLISWAFEDWLKEAYFDMLKVLEGWCNDEVLYARSRAVTYVYELLKDKPEQEANLLRLLVNKLGDPDKKIASRTSYLLLQLQVSHPLMKPIIIASIETELLLRPGQSSHAKYYAINTLNQTILRATEDEVAKKLLDIYFELFVSLLKKPDPKALQAGPVVNRKGQVQGGGAPMGKKAKDKAAKEEEAKSASQETTEKMISAVLTGVNRAFPFSKADDVSLEKHMGTLFRITHSSNFNTSIQALMLIEQLATSKQLSVDRFYRTLYESLLDPRLVTSSKHALYLNLLFRALRADLSIKRVKAFAKRLLQIVTLHQPPFICGIIYLLRELETTFPGLKTLLTDPEADDEDDEEVFRDVPEDEDLNVPEQEQNIESKPVEAYDGRKRDPEHSNADKSCLWESIPFLVHFHPSVSLFASRLVNNETMPPKPDLTSHTLSAFLDRFVYRNAKSVAEKPRGSSIMQPLSGSDNKGILLSNKSAQASLQPVNTEAFWRKKAEDVAVDEVFFHKYFSQIGKGKQAGKQKVAKERDDGEEGSEDEDEIWKALVESRPEVEGDSDDSDMEMLDLDDSDAEEVSDVDIESDDGGVQLMDVDEDEDISDMAGSDASEAFVSGSEADAASDDEDEDALFSKELQTAQPEKDEDTKESSRKKRRKLKSLPTFASMEDYAEMLDNDDDEDV